eukprot:6201820-Pleurochrysis_carterae.AAC.1
MPPHLRPASATSFHPTHPPTLLPSYSSPHRALTTTTTTTASRSPSPSRTRDLPKLKAYPWERVFPSGTSARAIDLAHRLLCYDPAQRLSASQALEHPFFESVQYLLSGTGNGPPLREQHTAWQKKVQARQMRAPRCLRGFGCAALFRAR